MAPAVELSPVAGDQVYVVPPIALRSTLVPSQIVGAEGLTVMESPGAIVTVAVAEPEQPFIVFVQVYVVVDATVAVTDEPVVVFRPVAGDQE